MTEVTGVPSVPDTRLLAWIMEVPNCETGLVICIYIYIYNPYQQSSQTINDHEYWQFDTLSIIPRRGVFPPGGHSRIGSYLDNYCNYDPYRHCLTRSKWLTYKHLPQHWGIDQTWDWWLNGSSYRIRILSGTWEPPGLRWAPLSAIPQSRFSCMYSIYVLQVTHLSTA